MAKLSDKSMDLVLTDIPYEVVNRKSSGLRNLDKGVADKPSFNLNDFLVQIDRLCKGSVYIFCSSEQVSQVRSTLVNQSFSTRHCIWEKTNPSPMNGQYIWLSSIENCIFGKRPGATFTEHCKSSVWRFSNGRSKIHPTEKPIKLLEYLIKTSSKEGDLVLDPCAGSFSTCLAAKNLNRKYIGIELNEGYYKLGVQRLNG